MLDCQPEQLARTREQSEIIHKRWHHINSAEPIFIMLPVTKAQPLHTHQSHPSYSLPCFQGQILKMKNIFQFNQKVFDNLFMWLLLTRIVIYRPFLTCWILFRSMKYISPCLISSQATLLEKHDNFSEETQGMIMYRILLCHTNNLEDGDMSLSLSLSHRF